MHRTATIFGSDTNCIERGVGSGERKRNSTRERDKNGGVTRAHQFSQMHASEKDAIRIPNGKARLHERTGAVTLLCSDQ